MTEQAKVPAIRFAGFTDPWEQRKFVDFVEASGIRNKDNLQLESYSVSNDRGFVPQDEQFENGGTMRDADKTAYWIVEPGSFAYNPARINVGSIGYQSTRKNVIVSSLYEVFKTDRSCDDRFLWHWFKSSLFTKQIEMLQEGGVRLYFFFDKLQKSEIWMPNVDEQRIIGQQFDQLDSLITLHQRKYDKLVILKKSMLEKMFPKDGESVPEIRFAGFTDPWEQRKLEDIANRVTRKNEGESDLPLTISSQYGLVDQRTFFNNQVASKDMSGYYLLRKGEFAYNKSTSGDSPWGAVKRLVRYEKGCVSTLYICFGLDGADPDFLVTYYETDRWYKAVQMIAAEGARNHGLLNIAPNDFFDTALILPPSREEQELIGLFFARLDNLITLHQRKYDKLVILKKSMLEKMFPKDGESVPEIRFAGFTDPWEQRKLEDIANRVTRKNEGESDLPLTISSQYGLVDQRTFFNNQVASKDMSGYYLLRKGEFAYNKSTSGDSPWGAVKRLVRYEKGCVSTLYICFGLDGADPDFLVTYYETDRWYKAVQMIAAEGARNHGLLNIAPNDFFDTALILPPSREEQELIGLFFARLDNLITLHQRKLELLQNIKKSLLDKMFV